ncbi:hypothetical protein R3P38DRAFT_2785012 [Favolaschia claudopus]|uniref:Transmembrane protein n=1 Tax=Favolaschia claudopus TaxID=2862362 RepID=A0AAW0AXN2_9AGAR
MTSVGALVCAPFASRLLRLPLYLLIDLQESEAELVQTLLFYVFISFTSDSLRLRDAQPLSDTRMRGDACWQTGGRSVILGGWMGCPGAPWNWARSGRADAFPLFIPFVAELQSFDKRGKWRASIGCPSASRNEEGRALAAVTFTQVEGGKDERVILSCLRFHTRLREQQEMPFGANSLLIHALKRMQRVRFMFRVLHSVLGFRFSAPRSILESPSSTRVGYRLKESGNLALIESFDQEF